MTEQNNDDTTPLPASSPPVEETRTLPPDPVLSAPAEAGPPAPPPGPRFRDKLWSLRAVIAVALASVLLGGAGGAVIANLTNGNDGRTGPGNRFGPGELQRGQMPGGQFGRGGGGGRFGGGFGGPGDFNGQQQGQQGTLPPGAPSAPSPQGSTPGAVS